MAYFTLTVDDRRVRRVLEKIKAGMTNRATRIVTMRVAMETLASLVGKTPKKWTGNTRKSWHVVEDGRAISVVNPNKVMWFLEVGTRGHGPVKAKMLFIPLNRKAALGGWDPSLVFGRDYVFSKYVRGIAARRIVRREIPHIRNRLQVHYRRYIQHLLANT